MSIFVDDDEWIECPGDGCWRRTLASELCEHHDAEDGSVCWTCCHKHHQDTRDPLEAA